jgi:hypothetical protein
MTEYHVTWAIEVTADNPTEAAMQARMILLDPESEATHFRVIPFGDLCKGYSTYDDVDLSDVDFTTIA